MRSAKVAYDDAYSNVYNDLKHGVLLGWLCVYIIYGDRSRGEQDQLLGKRRGCWLTVLHVSQGTAGDYTLW